MTDETDTDVLARLRRDPNCPAAVLLLAEQAARKGRLAEANERAEGEAWDDAVASSQSSIPPSLADPGSRVTNLSKTFYARLRAELQKALGLPVSAQLFGED
jgi:hypothetical protein